MTTLPTLTSFRPAPSLSDMVTLKKRLTDSLEDIANFVPQMQSVISAQNANNAEMQVLNDQVAQNAQNAQDAATTATQMAERAEAVVIPTNATYNLTQLDTRNTMMSKAQFNALAAERRANRAGSGFEILGTVVVA